MHYSKLGRLLISLNFGVRLHKRECLISLTSVNDDSPMACDLPVNIDQNNLVPPAVKNITRPIFRGIRTLMSR